MQAELDGILTPVFLGGRFTSFRWALRMYMLYGVTSHIYDVKFPRIFNCFSFIQCHRISYSNENILLMDLRKFAMKYDATIIYLVPISNDFKDFTLKYHEKLGEEFVIDFDTSKIKNLKQDFHA